ncbi:glycosyltransferase involved in cell wall biosynthesis [Bacillus fengqiuensis]|nr:glycosyltransferase involved in cell wall biosynthesis [Bacillus fengqiuensis]
MSKPLVSIVLATYFPNVEFFVKQLTSLNEQTYENMQLIVCDDSASEEQYKVICELVKEHILSFPFTLLRNKKNKGSNKTFEKLTQEADGKYIAYCDQDDIWFPHKIERLVEKAEHEKCALVYSDLSLIDENEQIIHKSFKKSHFRLKHVHGDNTFAHLVNRNSVTGCAMVIRTDIAKSAIPFPDYNEFVHDHWLTIHASTRGSLGYIKEPLVFYRIHSGNQIGNKRLDNVFTLGDYVYWRIEKQLEKYKMLMDKLKLSLVQRRIIEKQIQLTKARLKLYHSYTLRNLCNVVPLLYQDVTLFVFEVLLFSIPEKYSRKLIEYLKL